MDDQNLQTVYKDKATQKMLNTPLADPTGVDSNDQSFLESVIALIDDKTIDLYRPETLINSDVYADLSEAQKGEADLEAINILGALREIDDLYRNGFKDSFQIQNLVERVKNTKERTEAEKGDLFVI